MNLSRIKIAVFFAVIALLGWFLYPREVFLGYILEGQAEFKKAEKYYQDYLSARPRNRFAVMRLVHLYERMAEPEKIAPLLAQFYESRQRDWKSAQRYLTHLNDLHLEEELYQARLEIADNFSKVFGFSKKKIEPLYEAAYQYALWTGRPDEAYEILKKLIPIAKNPEYYREVLIQLDLGLHNTKQVIARLNRAIETSPHKFHLRDELLAVYQTIGNSNAALKLIEESLELAPNYTPFYLAQMSVYDQLGRDDRVIETIQRLLLVPNIEAKMQAGMMAQLAYLYVKNNLFNEGVAVYQKLRDLDPDKKEYWSGLIDALVRSGQEEAMWATLDAYLKRFPNDKQWEEFYVQQLLFVKKDFSRLPDYQRYIQKYQDTQLASDVAYGLIERKQLATAREWLNDMLALFGSHIRLMGILADVYLEEKNYPQALEWAEKIYHHNPQSVQSIQRLALIYSLTNQKLEAKNLYEKLAELQKDNSVVLRLVAKEIFFLGFLKESRFYFNQVLKQKPKDVESLFWLSEIFASQSKKSKSKKYARKVLEALGWDKAPKPSPHLRMGLKSMARLRFNQHVEQAYTQAFKDYPDDLELRFDLMDVYLTNQKISPASQLLSQLQARHPQPTARLLSLEIQLKFYQEKWQEAIALMHTREELFPYQKAASTDLAYALMKNRQWKKAYKVYSQLLKETPDHQNLKQALIEFHDLYDHRLTPYFRLSDLGSDKSYEYGLRYQGYWGEKWQMEMDVLSGSYQANSQSLQDTAQKVSLKIKNYYFKDWVLAAGLGFGKSDSRNSPAAELSAHYQPHSNFHLTLAYEHRRLRSDIPQAIVHGTLFDEARLQMQYRTSRLIMANEYRYRRSYLPDGGGAREHKVAPSLKLIVWDNPDIHLGYRFDYSHVSDNKGFLSKVPLLTEVATHFLTASIGHQFGQRLFVSGEFFMGEDPVRQLSLLEGELWGASSYAKWRALNWLDVIASYHYGRETLLGLAGQSHFVNVSLSGHWY